jgi:hypothetical protein
MDPVNLAKAGTEHAHQCALFCWAANNREKWPELEWMFAIPNGGERNKVVASRLKAEGVKSGVSDIMLPVARRGYLGFFIEMKEPKRGRESEKQAEFGQFVKNNGYLYIVGYGWESAAQYIAWYMGNDDGTY